MTSQGYNMKPSLIKRWRHPGDPDHWGDWLVVEIDYLPTEAGYRRACQALADATANPRAFLDIGNGGVASHFKLYFANEGERINERVFFSDACKFDALWPLVAQYARNVNADPDQTWQDEYHPAGSYALAALALADERYAGLLGEMLFGWDMEHETYHHELINAVFERHGFTDGTLSLLVSRCFADGQDSGANIWAALHPLGFKNRIDLERFAGLALGLPKEHMNILDLGFQQFATIYAGNVESDYRRALPVFSKALFAAEKFDFADWRMSPASIHPALEQEFSPHRYINDWEASWATRHGDWNAGYEDAEVESTDWGRVVAL